MKLVLRLLGGILVLFLLYVVVVLVYGTLNDYVPKAREARPPDQTAARPLIGDSVLTFVSWNVGFGGLGAESDFFYDDGGFFFAGGGTVISDRELVEKNVTGIRTFAASTVADFFLLQEVDRASKRSYFIDQYQAVRNQLPDFAAAFATNYRNDRVPLPVAEPWRVYGAVESGLASLSRWQPTSGERLQLPGEFPWPTKLFQLDRCLLVQRFSTKNNKTLTVVNLHLSAYDKGGALKAAQMEFLTEFLQAEYARGNYVVAGGDWNQVPPYFRFDSFMPGQTDGYTQTNISPDFLPADWTWAYDAVTPTNRKTRTSYVKGETFETLIDFFVVSPNVKVRRARGIQQGFQYSDHQPVYVEVELR